MKLRDYFLVERIIIFWLEIPVRRSSLSCSIVAEGIVGAVKDVGVDVPVVVRFEGNSAELGVKTLLDSDIGIVAATSLIDAVQQTVKLAGGAA